MEIQTSRPARYREITVSGSPLELGRQIGEAARDEIRGFCEIALAQVNKTVRVPRARAMQIAAESMSCAEQYSPDMLAELRGMAETARVSLDDLMLLQVRNQLQPERDAGCTSFAITGSAAADGHALVAQNWDNDPQLDEFTIVLTRHPTGKPACMTVTQAGLIAYIGFSDIGIGACLNTLPAPARAVGVPHYFTLRGIYEASSLDEAINAVRRAERAIPANIMLSTPEGPADLEVTIDGVFVLRDIGLGFVTHTNHCVHPELSAINDQFPELIDSRPRQCRIDALLHQYRGPYTVSGIQSLLADHDQYPRSICRHANDHPRHGFWKTVMSVVMQPTAGRMYVSRGNPCNCPFELYPFTSKE